MNTKILEKALERIAEHSTSEYARNTARQALHDAQYPAGVAPQPRSACKWFARCDRDAVTTVDHSVLGPVPCCQRCADFALR